MTTLLNELERTGARYGLRTMCEGGNPASWETAVMYRRLEPGPVQTG